jgi:hypothetical protein
MRRFIALNFWLVASCGGGKDLPIDKPMLDEVYSGCDPLDEALCALPFPSGYFQEQAETASGVQNRFYEESLPMNRDGVRTRPELWNRLDGFSTLTPMLAYFPDVSLDGTIGHDDIGAYTSADAKTVVIDANTGERIPHFVELDETAEEPSERTLMIRPIAPMAHGTRHIVAIRGLTHTDGSNILPSDAFAALRDGASTDSWDVEGRRTHFDADVFPALESAGFSRSDLQLAWDFTTVSEDNSLGNIVHMRDDALSQLPPNGPAYTIDDSRTEIEDCDAEGVSIHKTLYGNVTVPLYTDIDGPGARLNFDEAFLAQSAGTTQPEFMIRIPCSLAQDPRRTPMLLQYGHGLLGDLGEARTGWLSEMANDFGYVIFAMTWTGMSTPDAGAITLMLATDISEFGLLPERSQQGFVEWVYGLRMMTTSFALDPNILYPTDEGEISLIDGAPVGYYGNSQGAILGGAYTAISPDLERVVLGVGGMPYALLLSRSSDFDPFFALFKQKFLDHRQITLLLVAVQTLWDPAEAGGFGHQMNASPLPGTPPKDVLLQVARGDAQVTVLGAHVMARAYGASTVSPQTRPIWGVSEQAPGFSGSALVEYQYTDVPDEPYANIPPDDAYDTHECPRREPSAQLQLRDFLETGIVNHYCDGICEGLRAGMCD